MVAEEREVSDDQRPLRAAGHPARVEQHLLERNRERRVVAVQDVPHRVPDEDRIDAGAVDQSRLPGVVEGANQFVECFGDLRRILATFGFYSLELCPCCTESVDLPIHPLRLRSKPPPTQP